jgi:hypothetical protein
MWQSCVCSLESMEVDATCQLLSTLDCNATEANQVFTRLLRLNSWI